MKEIIEALDAAYRTMSSIPVTGDSIDMMAGARAKLRYVYAELKKMEENNGTDS